MPEGADTPRTRDREPDEAVAKMEPPQPPGAEEPENPVLLTARFEEALRLAFRLHQHQRRKSSGVPYVAHLLAVSALVVEDGGDEDEAIAALLHDALEDHADRITLDEIEGRFGSRVARIVAGCTDTPPDYHGGDKGPWLERKTAYIEGIRTAPPWLRVSLADKLHNARAILVDHQRIGDEVFERFTAKKHNTLWYYRDLICAFRQAGAAGHLIEELDRVVTEIEHRAGHPGGIRVPTEMGDPRGPG